MRGWPGDLGVKLIETHLPAACTALPLPGSGCGRRPGQLVEPGLPGPASGPTLAGHPSHRHAGIDLDGQTGNCLSLRASRARGPRSRHIVIHDNHCVQINPPSTG